MPENELNQQKLIRIFIRHISKRRIEILKKFSVENYFQIEI